MSLINESHDSLIYIDAQPTPDAVSAVTALISQELSTVDTTTPHPSLPHGFAPRFSELIQQEHDQLEAALPLQKGIDISRYESLDAPPQTSPHSDERQPEILDEWRETLKKAYTSSTYLQWRNTNLGLLETYGKNSWLIGNAQLEDILRGLEGELDGLRKEMETVEGDRKNMQERVKGEMGVLEETWKTGIGRVIETEVAVEGLRQQILEKKREGAVVRPS